MLGSVSYILLLLFYGKMHAVQKVFMHNFCSCGEEPENYDGLLSYLFLFLKPNTAEPPATGSPHIARTRII